MTDAEASECRKTCRAVHIDGECRTRCVKHWTFWNQGEGLRQTAAANEAAAAQRRAEAQRPFTDYLAAQRRRAHGA